MNDANVAPCTTLSAGARDLRQRGCRLRGWSEARRAQTAANVRRIAHWRVIEGGYDDAPDVEATWFVDPPYQVAGTHYKHPSTAIDFVALGAWCCSRRGQVIACEAEGADWLPFEPFMETKAFGAAGAKPKSSEVIWCSRMLDYLDVRR